VKTLQPLTSERGAILIHAAVALLVWFGIATFVVDYGVLWVSRHQAQNAADAGALAGALTRAYDDFDDPPASGGDTTTSVSQIVGDNPVWGTATPEVTSFTCPANVGAPRRCVRVDVYRNGDAGSVPLPTWFARVVGINSQGVKATATAQAMIANVTICLRPWAIPDSWTELRPGPEFTKYNSAGNQLAPFDQYTPPTTGGPGTGYRFATSNANLQNLGLALPLTFSTDPTNPIPTVDPIYRGWVVPLQPPAGYAASVAACNGQRIEIGDQLPISGTHPTSSDFSGLFAADSSAYWDAASASIHGSCAPSCAPFSPRLVAVPVFDTEIFQYRRATSNWSRCPPSRSCTPCPGGDPCVTIANIVGLFIGNAAGSSVNLSSYPGLIDPDPTARLTAQSSFLKAVTLVR
jgi:hypothetical protein